MVGIYSNSFRVIIFLRVLIGIAHMQDCQLQERSAVTAKSGDDVVFVSNSYNRTEFAVDLILESTGRYSTVARCRVNYFGDVYIEYTAPNVSVEVHLVEPRKPIYINIQNVTITMSNVSEADSGVYTLYADRHFGQMNCWTLYVLGERKNTVNRDYIEEGTLLNVTDFNHLSAEVVGRLNASTSWQIEDQVITNQSGYTVPITRNMDTKPLTYTIEGHDHNTTSVSFILNVSYTGPIAFVPNRTSYMYTLPMNETLQPTTCVASCNPTCNVIWKRGDATVSDTDILGLEAILLRTTEYTCHVTNTETGKQLNTSYLINFKGDRAMTTPDSGDSRMLVYVFASLMAVSVLITAAVTVRLCRHGLCTLSRPAFLRRAPQTDAVEMGAGNVVANVPDGSTARPTATYQDLQRRDGQENMYDGISTEVQQGDDRKNTYENMF